MIQQFIEYEELHGVVIRPGWLSNDVSLTFGRKRTRITYDRALAAPQVLLGVTMMIGVIAMGWVGMRFMFRFPLPDDDHRLKNATAVTRRDYRQAEKWALRKLLPDALLEQAEREEWENWRLVEACGLDEEAVVRRHRDWMASRRGLAYFA